MSNIWNSIGPIEPDLVNPTETIKRIFDPIESATNQKIGFRLRKANFFPEEVVVSFPSFTVSTISLSASILKENTKPHPAFGYDPDQSKQQEVLRYRLLLYPMKDPDLEVELLRFKFSLEFYPVQFFIDKTNFPELRSFVKKGELFAVDQKSLEAIVETIIGSSMTIKLIKRLMAL